MMQSEKHTLSFCFSTSIGHGMNMIKYLNGVYPLSSVLFIQEINLEFSGMYFIYKIKSSYHEEQREFW